MTARKTEPDGIRPLYCGVKKEPVRFPQGGHAGLWFDKFCNTWQVRNGCWTMAADRERESPKLDWIDSLCGQIGDHELLSEFAHRRIAMIDRLGGWWGVFRTRTRFVTGLGRSHPVENGFAWHPVLGTAYLPGSSVKGLLLDRVTAGGADKSVTETLFGKPGGRGALCFLDAVPTEPVRLEADVMTPHYAGWDSQDPPGDWRSPVPIPFLVAAEGNRFLFGLVPLDEPTRGRLGQVAAWLEQALREGGAGAKTAVGYGRMEPDRDATPRLREEHEQRARELAERHAEQRRLASLSPLDRELDDIANQPNYRGKPPYTAWLNELKAGRWSDDPASEHAVAERVRVAMQRAGKWKPKSSAKNPDKDTDHQRTLTVLRFLHTT